MKRIIINPDDYPPGFAEYAQPLLNARIRTLEAMKRSEKKICEYILRAFPELGRGPVFNEIVSNTRLSDETVDLCLERLNKIDMLKYDRENRQVLVLYPLSSVPCPHQVHIKGKKPVYAM